MKLTNNLYFYPEQGMLDCNTYVIKDEIGVIIDPGSAQMLPELIESLRKDGIAPEDIGIIVNTHLHGDHCWGDEAFREISGASIIIHPVQEEFYALAVIETAKFFGFPPIDLSKDRLFENSRLETGDLEFELICLPGHSPDSVCYYCKREGILICGDVVFARNTGRADLPGGNADQLRQSIEQMSRLEIEYLLPGHMDIVTGAEQVKRNFEYIKEHVLGWL
ncbi:MBL fold metallo-hydrolase [Chloroflexota bacterium]